MRYASIWVNFMKIFINYLYNWKKSCTFAAESIKPYHYANIIYCFWISIYVLLQ